MSGYSCKAQSVAQKRFPLAMAIFLAIPYRTPISCCEVRSTLVLAALCGPRLWTTRSSCSSPWLQAAGASWPKADTASRSNDSRDLFFCGGAGRSAADPRMAAKIAYPTPPPVGPWSKKEALESGLNGALGGLSGLSGASMASQNFHSHMA